MLALSATPKRNDGFDKFLNWTFGAEIFAKEQQSDNTRVAILQLQQFNEKEFFFKQTRKKAKHCKNDKRAG